MNRHLISLLRYLLIIPFLVSCGSHRNQPPKRELRGAWVATVVNIDWPKNGTDALQKKKQDYLEILDFYEELHFNTAIVQVRTAGDAFYPSSLSPWSAYLTGQQGQAEPGYDELLRWMIEETHQRGMEFHAWMNPYRATFNLDTASLSKDHDFFKHPEWMIRYGEKYYYDPGLPEVKDHLTSITNELVENYDIDAIHFDDYFYPYKIKGETFKDSTSYLRYRNGEQEIDDWRRANVDSLIRQLHHNIKSRKPWVQFGISPFGVWRNKSVDPRGSDTQAGQTNYDDLYADPLSWLRNGWIDYLAPQIYWTLDHKLASHRTILNWWDQNTENANLYVGNGAYRALTDNDPDWKDKTQLIQQVKLAREAENVGGNIYFSAKSLMKDRDEIVELLRETYKYKAIAPSMKGSGSAPVIAEVTGEANTKDTLTLGIQLAAPAPIKEVVVYDLKRPSKRKAERAASIKAVVPVYSSDQKISVDIPNPAGRVLIFSLVDRYGNESALKTLKL
ncbi:glycoside hydrolase family 10 protein [Robertkochia flava]|uniref:glycoside hydrolase family 10 protein n=1 Tax=Robertkochia flava TaxID=3447986 RepID=UPI001CCD2738|nr:family 10 glycosylhydrolase [Robertkochia marina]